MSQIKVVHLGTVVQTRFGVLDDDGNVIEQDPVTVQITAFERDRFVEAFTAIRDARDQAVTAAKDAPPATDNGEHANREQRRAAAKRTRAKAKP